MIVLCASCGWHDEGPDADASYRGANHLRVCPRRDDLTLLPWWAIVGNTGFEVGWHPSDINDPYVVEDDGLSKPYRVTPVHRYRFTEWADREVIGVRQAA